MKFNQKKIRALFLHAILLLGGIDSQATSKQATHTILISNMRFNPDRLEIKSGDLVLWKNKDIVPHTVTDKGIFDSGSVSSDKSFKFRFNKKGDYIYNCSFHPTMKASIVVK